MQALVDVAVCSGSCGSWVRERRGAIGPGGAGSGSMPSPREEAHAAEASAKAVDRRALIRQTGYVVLGILAAMSIPAPMLKRVVTPQSPDDARRIIEIACLAVASDGRLADEELSALRVLSSELRAVSAAELEPLIHAALGMSSRDDRTERLRTLADALSNEAARHCAYKVSVVTALADLASADEEFEFDLDVQDALRLEPEIADRLSAEVHEALIDAS